MHARVQRCTRSDRAQDGTQTSRHKGYGSAPATAVITGDTHGSIIEAISKVIDPALIGGEMQSPGVLQACLGQLAGRGPLLPLGRVVGFRDLFIKRKEVVNYPQPKHTHRQQI